MLPFSTKNKSLSFGLKYRFEKCHHLEGDVTNWTDVKVNHTVNSYSRCSGFYLNHPTLISGDDSYSQWSLEIELYSSITSAELTPIQNTSFGLLSHPTHKHMLMHTQAQTYKTCQKHPLFYTQGRRVVYELSHPYKRSF